MSEDLRGQIASALNGAGLTGFKDSTTPMRPQWRASFSFRGDLAGEVTYVHVYVPADADQLQVNSTAISEALNPMPSEQIDEELAEVNATYAPGSPAWSSIIEEIGASASDVAGWQAVTSPYVGLRHRMMLTRVTMPLTSLSASSLDLAIKLGIRLARIARENLKVSWEGSQEGK